MTVRSVALAGYRSALPAVGASALGGLVAGAILTGMEAELTAVPGLLVVVPAFLAIRGSVYGSLGSRLSTGLHQGLVQPSLAAASRDRALRVVAGSLSVGVAASLFAAVTAATLLPALGRQAAPLVTFVAVALVGAVLAGIVLSVVVVTVVFLGFRCGVNPDDLVGPAVTTAGDLFGLLSLVAAVRVVLWVETVL